MLIGDVTAGGPAARGGLQRGDVITSINAEPVVDPRHLRLTVASMAPGSEIQLGIVRKGSPRELSFSLGELPSDKKSDNQATEPDEKLMSGLVVEALTPEILRQLELPASTHGVVVDSVEPESDAGRIGLRRGDVIQEVNRVAVNTPSELTHAVRSSGDQPVLLLVNRGGQTF